MTPPRSGGEYDTKVQTSEMMVVDLLMNKGCLLVGRHDSGARFTERWQPWNCIFHWPPGFQSSIFC